MNKLTVAYVERFRAAYERFVVKLGMQFVNPVPAINDGYLHFLNASFDGLNLEQTKARSLLEPCVEANFGAIQPCVRAEDAVRTGYDLLHLGMFTILGTATWKFERLSPPQMARGTIGEFMGFYRDCLGMDPERLKIFCFGGATVREASKGVISNDEYIPPDGFSEELWREKGVEGLFREHTNETYLLHLGRPYREHHAGYRNDIFYILDGGTAFEIATLNFITHQTTIEGGRITGIKPLPFSLRETAFGLERLLAAGQGTADLYELPHINPLVKAAEKGISNPVNAMAFADALRVVHYVMVDTGGYDGLQGHNLRAHRQEVNRFMRIVEPGMAEFGKGWLGDLLKLNADLQPWSPQLQQGWQGVIEAVEVYGRRRQQVTDGK